MVSSPHTPDNGIEFLGDTHFAEKDIKVVLQCAEKVKVYRWGEVDGMARLRGGYHYGQFNFVIESFSKNPADDTVHYNLVETKQGDVFDVRDIAHDLLVGNANLFLLPLVDVEQLQDRLPQSELIVNDELQIPEDVSRLRKIQHCGTCTEVDCYCIRVATSD